MLPVAGRHAARVSRDAQKKSAALAYRESRPKFCGP
jgi:hypothetical protein